MWCQEYYADQKNFRVIYHENIDYKKTKELIKKLDIPDSKNAMLFPIIGEHKITLNKRIDYVNIQDIKFNDFFKKAYKEVCNKDLKDSDYYYKILSQEELEEFENKMETDKLYHQMLGYGYFRQEVQEMMKNILNMILYFYKLILKINLLCGVKWGSEIFLYQKSLY